MNTTTNIEQILKNYKMNSQDKGYVNKAESAGLKKSNLDKNKNQLLSQSFGNPGNSQYNYPLKTEPGKIIIWN